MKHIPMIQRLARTLTDLIAEVLEGDLIERFHQPLMDAPEDGIGNPLGMAMGVLDLAILRRCRTVEDADDLGDEGAVVDAEREAGRGELEAEVLEPPDHRHRQ